MPHDFKKFPELSGTDLDLYGWRSPHKQIFESFQAKVTKVKDGDTIDVSWHGRNFEFPVRFSNIAAPEMSEKGGEESRSWLEKQILGKVVTIEVNPDNRVGKWGRLLGKVNSAGVDLGEMSVLQGKSVAWSDRKKGKITFKVGVDNPWQ